jgi:hypothetical protein
MIKIPITFEDFDGNQVTEDHYFHLSKSKLLQMDAEAGGNLGEQLAAMVGRAQNGNGAEVITTFKDFLSKAYGLRDPANPRKFEQSEKISADFMDSPAFDAMLTDMMDGKLDSAELINGIIPKDLAQKAAAMDVALPDPNKLDSASGTWPRGETVQPAATVRDDTKAWPADNGPQPPDSASGLANPRDIHGVLVPWAFREPTRQELLGMVNEQKVQVYARKSSGWQPFQFKTS